MMDKALQNRNFGILYLTIFLVTCIGLVIIHDRPLFIDEKYHYGQITNFLQGNYSIYPELTVIPGYHMIVVGIAEKFDIKSLGGIRAVSGIILVLTLIPLFYILTQSWRKTAILYFFPTMFSFYFLVYTDLMSLMLVLMAIWMYQRSKYNFSGLFIVTAILVRQNNVIWLGMLMLMAFIELIKICKNDYWTIIINYIKYYWAYCLSCILFLIFMIINKGILIQNRTNHNISFYFTNIWYILFISFFLFMPFIIFKAKEIGELLTQAKGWIIVGAVTLAGFITYNNSHWYNNINNPGIVRNVILQTAASNTFILIAFLIVSSITVLWLMTVKFKNNMYKYVTFFSIIYLGMSEMVDTRYYMIPFALFIIMREDDKDEYFMLIYSISLATLMFIGVMSGKIIFW